MKKNLKKLIIVFFLLNLIILRAADIKTGETSYPGKLNPPTKIFCKKSGYWISNQCSKNLESIEEDKWKSTKIHFSLQDTITAHYEDAEYFYSAKKIPGSILFYRLPKEAFSSKPPPKNLKKYDVNIGEKLYVRKNPSKTSEIVDTLKKREDYYCYDNEHKETDEGCWVKGTTGDWTDSSSIRWIRLESIDSTSLLIPPFPLNEKEIMQYPKSLSWKGLEGKVVTELWIDSFGNVRNVIIKESTHPDLRKLAEESTYKLKFRPAMVYPSKPIAIRLSYPVEYSFPTKAGE